MFSDCAIISGLCPAQYEDRIKESWIYKELKAVRNVRPSFNTKLGIYGGLAYTGLFYVMARGKEPWTLSHSGMSFFVIFCGLVTVVNMCIQQELQSSCPVSPTDSLACSHTTIDSLCDR